MIFVGERINTGFKDIKQAVVDRDPAPLQAWAKKQTAAGAATSTSTSAPSPPSPRTCAG